MNTQQLLAIQRTILDALKSHETDLQAIQSSDAPVIKKWQEFLSIMLAIKLDALQSAGFAPTQEELSKFNQSCMHESGSNKELQELNNQKWYYIFNKAFGLKEVKHSTLSEAKSLINDIVASMTADAFLCEIDSIIAQLSPSADIIQRRQALLNILIPLHMRVMEKHGYIGDAGYVQAQRALMDFYHDPEISSIVNQAQTIVFKRAQLL